MTGVYPQMTQMDEDGWTELTVIQIERRVQRHEKAGEGWAERFDSDSEAWLYRNPKALASVRRGLQDVAAGRTRSLGSFAQFAADDRQR